jgi:hypothetical protein
MIGAESGIDVIEVREALEQQAGTHQKNEGEGHLPGDQHPARPHVERSGEVAAESAAGGRQRNIALEGGDEIPAERGKCGREAEDDAGEHGEREREAEDAEVKMDLRTTRQFERGGSADVAQSNPGEQNPERTADHGEQRALGEQLSKQAIASCSERRAQSELPGACCGAGQQQTGPRWRRRSTATDPQRLPTAAAVYEHLQPRTPATASRSTGRRPPPVWRRA